MRWVALLFLVVADVASTGCTKHNGLNCNDGVCTDPNFPFCDTSGQFGDSANTCIAVTCTPSEFEACRGNDALVCNAIGNDYDALPCSTGCSDAAHGCIECTADTDCDSLTPHCTADGVCVTCVTNAQCTDPLRPHCDEDTHQCAACAADNDCDSQVCDVTLGRCVDESDVAYAATNGTGLACTLNVPCPVSTALAVSGKTIVKLLAGSYPGFTYPGQGQGVVIHGEGATVTDTINFTSNSGFSVTILGLTINIGSGDHVGITCAASAEPKVVNLDHVSATVPQTVVSNCNSVFVVGSSFKGMTAGVLVAAKSATRSKFEGGQLKLPVPVQIGQPLGFAENCIFERANPAVSGGAGTSVQFSTFFNATADCTAKLVLSNDIMIGTTTTPLETGTCEHHFIISMPAVTTQSGDTSVMTADPRFKDASHDDFHLLTGSPAIDAADPAATTGVDFDGKMRPQGTGRDIGAFELTP